MSRDRDLMLEEPAGLDGSTTISTDATEYIVALGPCYVRSIYSMVESAPDFTTGDEQGRILVTYSTDGSNYVAVFTGALANANTWTALVPKAETMTDAIRSIRIPGGAVIRVIFDVNGTTPSFPSLHVAIGLIVV